MFSVNENTIITGLNGMKLSHIIHQLWHGGIIDRKFSYFGPVVAKGTVLVNTKYGVLRIKFDEHGGWARHINIAPVDNVNSPQESPCPDREPMK